LDRKKPENYFRIDLGISYTEVSEMAFIKENVADPLPTLMTSENITGLINYKPTEGAD
jgi:hypothetical protein